MNKIAAYELLLEDHPLWTKEAEEGSVIPGAVGAGLGGALGLGAVAPAALTLIDRRNRAAIPLALGGAALGSAGGVYLGSRLAGRDGDVPSAALAGTAAGAAIPYGGLAAALAAGSGSGERLFPAALAAGGMAVPAAAYAASAKLRDRLNKEQG